MLVVGPADERVPRLAGECGGTETDDGQPLTVATERDVAHRLADQMMTEPMVLVERLVEADPLSGEDRAHGHGTELGVRHRTRITRVERKAPVPSGLTWSCGYSYDFVVALPDSRGKPPSSGLLPLWATLVSRVFASEIVRPPWASRITGIIRLGVTPCSLYSQAPDVTRRPSEL